jgi:4-amino-4-deoxy-L-arabinose transferase-like glycosyltransferase
MHTRLVLALAGALLLFRLPAIIQPMGADQALYSYVGERILASDLPYRDAWDQKPPAVHYTYAAIRAIWPGDAGVGAADFVAAAAVAWLLFRLGIALAQPAAGGVSALLFLLLSNPSFTRLAGVRLRSQCETFIAVAVTAAFLLLARRRTSEAPGAMLAAGALFGLAFLFKYNAGIYAAAGLAALWAWRRLSAGSVVRIAVGFVIPVAVMLAIFAAGGALRDLYDATITYNLQYSGETYAGPLAVLGYLMTFPVQHARIDALWTLGGAGTLLLLALAVRDRDRLVPVAWVAAACVSIAVNGSRGLPQYFVQAAPALALAAGWGAVEAWRAMKAKQAGVRYGLAAVATALVIVAVWRVNQFPKLFEQTAFDARYALGSIDRTTYLARYADDRKYSALAAAQLAAFVRGRTQPEDTIYVFGFTCAVYVDTNRESASRFFWSRPVIAGFNAGVPGYGAEGLLADLERRAPAIVALQRKDWAPDVADSADFFMSTPELAGWLLTHYEHSGGPEEFDVWIRKAGVS